MSKPKYKDAFLDHMMIHERGMETPDADDSPAKAYLLSVVAKVRMGVRRGGRFCADLR